jgi:hypothetical protein
MSRAYRIVVQENVSDIVCVEDSVTCQLELLGILPGDQMATVLANELQKQGFERDGDAARRTKDGIAISVDLKTGHVVVRSEKTEEMQLDGQATGFVYSAAEARAEEEKMRKQLQQELEKRAKTKVSYLQEQATSALEAQLGDLRAELDGAVNRATAEALKQRAAQLGQIKAITEDPQAGSLTIVVEV